MLPTPTTKRTGYGALSRFLSTITILLSFALFNPSAQAQTTADITVGGIDYRITMVQGSFNAVQAATGNALTDVSRTPWYTPGNFSLANTFATAFRNATTFAATPPGAYHFAYQPTTASYLLRQNSSYNNPSIIGVTATNTQVNNAEGAFNISFATAEIVPEINGGTLAKILLILMAGYLWVSGRRGRNGSAYPQT